MGSLAMSLWEIPGRGTSRYSDSAAPGCPWDSSVPEGGRKDDGMLGLLKDGHGTAAGRHGPGVVHPGGYSCSSTPAANPALPSCLWAPKQKQKGASGLLRSPGTQHQGPFSVAGRAWSGQS